MNHEAKLRRYRRASTLVVPRKFAFDWHTNPGAFERLSPPWNPARIESRTGQGVEPGATVSLRVKVGPLWLPWVAEHGEWEPGYMFSDRQVTGPFERWEHQHSFAERADNTVELIDEIRYQLPLGYLGRLGGHYAQTEIDRMFAYRHRVTVRDTAWHAQYGSKQMNVAVTGSTGLVGSALLPFLESGGHTVVSLRRGTRPLSRPRDQPTWDPNASRLYGASLDGVDAVVHLAGENIAAARWSDAQKARIRDSRVDGTRHLCEALTQLEHPPKTLVVASAIGFYGDRGDERLTENSEPGTGFLPEVCEAWEAAADVARAAGIRVVHLRVGIVLTPAGGALKQMLLPFTMGVGGVIGSGQQFMSWVSLDDVLAAVLHALVMTNVEGPVNVVAPRAVNNAEFTKTLGRVLRRPTIFPLPGFMARLVFGEMADGLLLSSTCVVPGRLQETGFSFGYPDLEGALRHLLGR